MQLGKLKTCFETGRVIFLPVRAIKPNPAQPRQIFDQEELQTLAASIGQFGVLQPLSVRRVGNQYQLVAGERRLRAARLAGLEEVPCLLMNLAQDQSAIIALVENLQRKDLDYIEQAQGLARLLELTGMSQEQLSQKVGKSQSAVANKLRLLRHSGPVLEALRQQNLTERHARALLRLEKEPDKLLTIDHIVRENLTVAQTESYIQQVLAQKALPGATAGQHPVSGTGRTGETSARPRVPDVRAFLTGLTENLARIQRAGIPAVTCRQETEKEITLTITIAK